MLPKLLEVTYLIVSTLGYFQSEDSHTHVNIFYILTSSEQITKEKKIVHILSSL